MRYFELNFKGYVGGGSLPETAGLYCAYTTKINEKGILVLDQLVYIGESRNIRQRQLQHVSNNDFPEPVVFSYVETPDTFTDKLRKQCESALIYECQPRWNNQGMKLFNYDDTQVISTGEHYRIPDKFTVYRA